MFGMAGAPYVTLVALLLSVQFGHGLSKQQEKTPAKLYQALVDEESAEQLRIGNYRKAKSEGEKRSLLHKSNKHLQEYADRFYQFASKYPQEPAASDALIWIIKFVGFIAPETTDTALDLLLRDHFGSESFLKFSRQWINRGVIGDVPHFEKLYRGIMSKSADRATQGKAAYLAALCLEAHTETVERLRRASADVLKREEAYWGVAYVNLRCTDLNRLNQEREEMLEKVVKEYANIQYGSGSLGKRAGADLYELRHLAPGKPAPEIEGEDIDGTKFRLSDYRREVVVLDFWGDWCSVCRARYADELSLLKRFQGKSFAILGVNSDKDKNQLKQMMRKENITWRSWWDGGGTHGPIANNWNVHRWPVVYLLDGKGIIRYKYHGMPNKDLEDAIIALLKESKSTSTD